jgi:hypothetical protein
MAKTDSGWLKHNRRVVGSVTLPPLKEGDYHSTSENYVGRRGRAYVPPKEHAVPDKPQQEN